MSPWTPVGLAAFLLILPRFFRPRPTTASDFDGLLSFLWYVNAGYCSIVHRLQTEPAPLPDRGPAILIANHTCNIDHCLLQAGSGRKLGFLIAREYHDNWLIRPICRLIGCIPVNRDGRDLAATRAALRALRDGRVVPMFPEGRILQTSGREIGEGKHGVAFLAIRAKVPVIPAYIWGTPRSNILWRSITTPSSARVVYGTPIDPTSDGLPQDHADERAALAATTERYMDAIRALRDREQARAGEFRGS